MTGHGLRQASSTRIAVAIASGAVASVVLAPGHAAAVTSKNTFYGRCSIVGTDIARNSSSVFRGHGVCIGSLNGGAVKSHRVVEIVREHGLISPDYFGLPALHGQSSGEGVLQFGSRTVRFAIQQSFGSFTLQGIHDGIGSGSATQMPKGMLRMSMTTCGTTLAG
jgi:hypothetical protein